MYTALKLLWTAPLGTIFVAILAFLAILRDRRWLVLLWTLQSIPVAAILRSYLPLPWAVAQVFVAGVIALVLMIALAGRRYEFEAPTHWLWRLGFLPLTALVVWWIGGRIPEPWHGNLYLLSLASVATFDILVGDDRLSSGIGLLLAWEAFLIVMAMTLPPQTTMLGLYLLEVLLGLSTGYLVLVEGGQEGEAA